MIVKYNFLSKVGGEKPEVEVDENLGQLIEQMNADDHNLNRAETRRHIYMSQLEESGHYIADECDLLDDVLREERIKELMAAIEKLLPEQKELLIRVYWNNELQKNIAAEEGVSEMTISRRMKKIYAFLKKFLK